MVAVFKREGITPPTKKKGSVGAGFTPARKSLLKEQIPHQAEEQEQGHDQKSATEPSERRTNPNHHTTNDRQHIVEVHIPPSSPKIPNSQNPIPKFLIPNS